MQQFFNQLLQFLQQGIAAIFKFVQMIWTWSVAQIGSLDARSLARLAVVEANLLGAHHRGHRLRPLQGGCGTVGSGRKNIGRVRHFARRTCEDAAQRDHRWCYRVAGLWVLNNVDLSRVPLPSFLQTTSLER